MKIFTLDKTKRKKFLEEVSYFGNFKTNLLFLQTGVEKVRAFSGSMTNEEIMAFWRMFPIEGVGMYIGKLSIDKSGRKEARLSTDALHYFKDQIKTNIVELNEDQAKEWFFGKPVALTEKQIEEYKDFRNFVAVKFGEDFVGTGKISQDGRVQNFLPKERRVRESS
ncbi:tRNA pseudouridine(55) synthase TruB [archaeon]|nr:tRNA pseudouridine(55) synthase TruB [archaeon]